MQDQEMLGTVATRVQSAIESYIDSSSLDSEMGEMSDRMYELRRKSFAQELTLILGSAGWTVDAYESALNERVSAKWLHFSHITVRDWVDNCWSCGSFAPGQYAGNHTTCPTCGEVREDV